MRSRRTCIYAHYILGMSKSDIARAEGVNEKAVRVAIKKGLIKAMTFEKVLDVFADYIESDNACEVIHTKQGYTVM